jgi:DNA repair exonuclease SbcCD nuclease subunit
VQAAIDSQADAVLIAGDLFDRSVRSPEAENAVENSLTRLQGAQIPVYCVYGNHDFYGQGADCLMKLQNRSLLHLLQPELDDTGGISITAYNGHNGCVTIAEGVRIVGLGYLGDRTRERLAAILGQLAPNERFTVVMLHTGVYAGSMPVGGITRQDLQPFDGLVEYFALGHRHAREEHGNAYNPGSPCGMRMIDTKQEHGYYLVDVRGKEFRNYSFLSLGPCLVSSTA